LFRYAGSNQKVSRGANWMARGALVWVVMYPNVELVVVGFGVSKWHCSASLYSMLALRGFFPEEELAEFMEPLSRLNGAGGAQSLAGMAGARR